MVRNYIPIATLNHVLALFGAFARP